MYRDPFIQQGWQCPKCGRIYSPNQPMCFFCYNEHTTITASNTTSTYCTKLNDYPYEEIMKAYDNDGNAMLKNMWFEKSCKNKHVSHKDTK